MLVNSVGPDLEDFRGTAGTRHWFRFGAGGGEMVSLTSRAGAAKMFAEVDREIAPAKPDFAKLVEVAGRHGAKLGVPGG